MNKFKIALIVGIVGLTSIASAATLSPSEFAVRQQMIDFAKYFPNLVQTYYPESFSGITLPNQSGQPKLGSVAGPDLPSPYFIFGGLATWQARTGINVGASTTCSYQLPAATTTFSAANINFTNISSTTVVEIGYSLFPNTTTTLLASRSVTTGTQDAVISSSTPFALGSFTPPYALAPNAYINIKTGGGGVRGTVDPAGSCTFRVTQIAY